MPGFLDKIIGTVKDIFGGKSKARKLMDQLKDDPANTNLAQQVKDLFVSDPISVVKEVIRRASGAIKVAPSQPVDHFVKLRQTWDNTIKKERVQPLQYLRPQTKKELVDIIKQAESDGLMVRAVGTGHSFSDVANATDILVDMLQLNAKLDVEADTLKPFGKPLYNAQAGMMVEKINTELDALGLALPTMAAFDQETIYGAIATSTHGTGLNVAGMAAMVRSMDLLAAGGTCYRLEPSDGITDPVKFKAKYPNNEIILIQDTDKFHSSVVGFGLMGIVYSVLIEPRQTFYLKQRLWVTDWTTVKPKLLDRSFFTTTGPDWKPIGKDPVTNQSLPNRAQVFVNPYVTKNFITKSEQHTCVVQIQTEISKAEFDELMKQVKKNNFINKIANFIESIFKNGDAGFHMETVAAEDKNSITEELSTDALLILLNDFPLLTPLFLDISLIVLLSGSGKIGKSFEVMNQGKLAVKNAGYSTEPGFAVDAKNAFVTGAEKIIDVVALSQKSQSYLTAPFCMRFVQQSDDYLSPEYKADTCMIDVPLILGSIGDDQMLQRMQLDLVALGARPHWGKICDLVNGEALIHKMYPKFDQFLDTVKFFNPKGTFNSSFSYRTGISKMVYERS